MSLSPYLIAANWPAPPSVNVFHTTRWGGVSLAPYGTWNMGDHVGDCAAVVAQNRSRLCHALSLSEDVQWLKQIHSTVVVTPQNSGELPEADGVFLAHSGQAAVVMTADCLPIVLCRSDGRAAAVVHAGWRGLAQGIVAQAHARFARSGDKNSSLMAWIGPCILPQHFEVDDVVRDAFVGTVPAAQSAFIPKANGRWYGMLTRLAYLTLKALGVTQIYGFGVTQMQAFFPVFSPFFSYRQANPTGRFATILSLGAV